MNMYDYLIWRGDLSFENAPFNNVDNLLFSYISYVNLDNILYPDNRTVTLKQASDRYFETVTEQQILEDKSFIAQSALVLKAMASTIRFKDVLLSNYVSNFSVEDTEQFAAMKITFKRDWHYIAYRGTDDSMVGWKEDFQLSYKVIDSEKMALQYLEDTIGLTGNYYVGGHSKGGTLALYASVFASERKQKKIVKVFSNDGPELSELCYDEEKQNRIADRYVKIMPSVSIIGMLYDRKQPKTVIKAKQFLIMQHDPVSWQIRGTDFEKEEELSEYSYMIWDGLRQFLDKLDLAQREKVVNEVFDAFTRANVNYASDIMAGGYKVLLSTIKEMSGVDEDAKQAFSTLIGVVVKMVTDKTAEAFKERKEAASQFLEKSKDSLMKNVDYGRNKAMKVLNELEDSISDKASDIWNDKKEEAGQLLEKSKETILSGLDSGKKKAIEVLGNLEEKISGKNDKNKQEEQQ